MNQTVTQNSNSFRIGSAKFQVGDDVGSLVDLGAMNGVQFEESWEEVRQQTDNAGEVLVAIRNHRCRVAGDLAEINLANLNNIRGGIDSYSTQAAEAVSVTNENVVLTGVVQKRLANKNASGAEVGSIVVTDAAGNTTYVRNTDYVVSVDAEGYTCIARIAAGGITSAQTVLVDYQYTPAASVTLKTGGKIEITPKVVRLTNTNPAGKVLRITAFKANNSKGISIAFKSDDSGELNTTPIEMTGTKDVSRTVGEQLFEIYDEQGV